MQTPNELPSPVCVNLNVTAWATIWIIFQLLCLGGFSMLGIYAFKASSPVPTVATHPNLPPLIQLTKAEMDAQAGSPSFFLHQSLFAHSNISLSTIFTHMISLPWRCFMNGALALSTDTIDENETNMKIQVFCFICMARIIDKIPGWETTICFFVARSLNLSYYIYFLYIMVANDMLYH